MGDNKNVAPGNIVSTNNVISNKEGRQKSTLNLSDIGKVQKTADETPATANKERVPDRPIDEEILKSAWDAFTVLRKNQIGEYEILRRGYQINGTKLKVSLISNVEEMILTTMRTQLIAFLRDRTGNSSLLVEGEVDASTPVPKKLNNKDSFHHLAEKNPVLKDLKERFGLDPDLA